MTFACSSDPAAVYTSKTVQGRAEHICCECGGKIRKGERHELAKGLWDGEWDTFRTCPDCVAWICDASSSIKQQSYYGTDLTCSAWLHGGMREFLEELRQRYYDKDVSERLIASFNATAPGRGAARATAIERDDDDT